MCTCIGGAKLGTSMAGTEDLVVHDEVLGRLCSSLQCCVGHYIEVSAADLYDAPSENSSGLAVRPIVRSSSVFVMALCNDHNSDPWLGLVRGRVDLVAGRPKQR